MAADAINEQLRRTCGSSPIDGKAFARRVASCSLADCKGMCCYDGVYVDAPTEAAITALVDSRRSDFVAMGLNLPEAVVVDGDWLGQTNARKTARRAWDASAAVADYPKQFTQTTCVFHLDDGRCGFQVLAMQDGVHPWTYKPHPCWLFPITIQYGKIALYDEIADPTRHDGYEGFVAGTRCGRTCSDGRPAIEIVAQELRYLGTILGRELIAEVNDQRES